MPNAGLALLDLQAVGEEIEDFGRGFVEPVEFDSLRRGLLDWASFESRREPIPIDSLRRWIRRP